MVSGFSGLSFGSCPAVNKAIATINDSKIISIPFQRMGDGKTNLLLRCHTKDRRSRFFSSRTSYPNLSSCPPQVLAHPLQTHTEIHPGVPVLLLAESFECPLSDDFGKNLLSFPTLDPVPDREAFAGFVEVFLHGKLLEAMLAEEP